MNIEGNPFSWGFVEDYTLKTLAQQKEAKYSEPQEVTEQKEDLFRYNTEVFGHSPNIAHITGVNPLETPPYTENIK